MIHWWKSIFLCETVNNMRANALLLCLVIGTQQGIMPHALSLPLRVHFSSLRLAPCSSMLASFALGLPVRFSCTSWSLDGGGREKWGDFYTSSWAELILAAFSLKVTTPICGFLLTLLLSSAACHCHFQGPVITLGPPRWFHSPYPKISWLLTVTPIQSQFSFAMWYSEVPGIRMGISLGKLSFSLLLMVHSPSQFGTNSPL